MQRVSGTVTVVDNKKIKTHQDKQNILTSFSEKLSTDEFKNCVKKWFTDSENGGKTPNDYVNGLLNSANPQSENNNFDSVNGIENLIINHLTQLNVQRSKFFKTEYAESYKVGVVALQIAVNNIYLDATQGWKLEDNQSKLKQKAEIFLKHKEGGYTWKTPAGKKFVGLFQTKHIEEDRGYSKTYTVNVMSDPIFTKKYSSQVKFKTINYSHLRKRWEDVAKNQKLISKELKANDLMPFLKKRIEGKTTEQIEKLEKDIDEIVKKTTYDQFLDLDCVKKNLVGPSPTESNTEHTIDNASPEFLELLAVYLLSHNRHAFRTAFRSNPHATKSIEKIREFLHVQKIIEEKAVEHSKINKTLEEIQISFLNTSYTRTVQPTCKPTRDQNFYVFQRLSRFTYFIELPDAPMIGEGGSKVAKLHLKITVDPMDGSCLNMQPVVRTTQTVESYQASNAKAVITKLREKKRQIESSANISFDYFHLGYDQTGNFRNTQSRSSQSRLVVSTVQSFLRAGDLKSTPHHIQNPSDFLLCLYQMAMALNTATACGVAVTDAQPQNIFIKTVEGKKRFLLADMDDWLLRKESDDDEKGIEQKDIEVVNQGSFYLFLRQMNDLFKTGRNLSVVDPKMVFLNKLNERFFEKDATTGNLNINKKRKWEPSECASQSSSDTESKLPSFDAILAYLRTELAQEGVDMTPPSGEESMDLSQNVQSSHYSGSVDFVGDDFDFQAG